VAPGDVDISDSRHRYIGESLQRLEDEPYLRGDAQFVADLIQPATLHAAFLRSSVASGGIDLLDVTDAVNTPGVVAVATGADLADQLVRFSEPQGAQPGFTDAFHIQSPVVELDWLAVDRVRYVGEPIVVVVARSRYVAEDAVSAIRIEYSPDEAVVDLERAVRPGSPLVHSSAPENVSVSMHYTKGQLPDVRQRPDLVTVERVYRIGRQTALPIECRGVLATPEGADGIDIWSATQSPFVLKETLCDATGWEPESVRVRCPMIGGAFGQKASVYPEEIVVPLMAKQLRRSVAWLEDRYENLVSATQARDQIHHARLTVDREGRIVAWEDEFLVDFGVYNYSRFGVVGNTAVHLLGPYNIPNLKIRGRGVFTNKTPTSQYRGAGRPEATFALERSLDAAARKLGQSSYKLRQINALGSDELPLAQNLPYRDDAEIVYDGRDYKLIVENAVNLVSEQEIATLKQAALPSQRIGVGIAAHVEATGRGPEPESARITLTSGGRLIVRTGIGVTGQSHATVFAQIAAEAARIDIGDVRVVTGDTSGVPFAVGSIASRSAVIAGSAVWFAARRLVDLLADCVRQQRSNTDVEHIDNGFRIATGEVVTWREIAGWFGESGPFSTMSAEVTHVFTPIAATWMMGVHIAVVSVDVETGEISVLRYGLAHESGQSINPRIVDGQLRGAVIQGVGGALLEEVAYDAGGQPTSVSLADYLIPGSGETPRVRLSHVSHPSATNPLGVKGIGESGIIATNAAIAAAVDNALQEYDVHVERTPIVSDYVLSLIRGG
jgi:carbon-monoxide dehydrogenase large subunit